MPQPLLIFPYNGNAIEAADCLGDKYKLIGFIDDTPEKQGVQKNGSTVFDRNALIKYPDAQVLAVPGSPTSFTTRDKVIESLGVPVGRFATVIHPGANISPQAKIGANVLIMGGVWISAGATIGDHVCILPNTVIHHDSSIGDYTLVGSGVCVAGNSHIGTHCYIGSASSIINGISIGKGTLVGIGSNVIRNVEPGSKVAGNPTRKL